MMKCFLKMPFPTRWILACSISFLVINSQKLVAQQAPYAAKVIWDKYYNAYSQNDFQAAMHELKRLDNFGHDKSEILYAKGEVYKAQKNWDSAYANFYKIIQPGNTSKNYHSALYNCQLLCYLQGKLADEVFFYKTIQRDSTAPDSVYFDSQFISILSDLKAYNWDGAKQGCKSLFTDSTYNWDSVFASTIPIKLKSPKRAGKLSIIPGVGQMYAGHFSRGTQSLLLQSALAAGITVAVISHSYVIGGLFLTPLLLRFHYGGKMLAYKMVETENENKNSAAENALTNYIIKYAKMNGEL